MLNLLAQTLPESPATVPAVLTSPDYGPLPAIFFYLFALLTLLSAFSVALAQNIVRAAVGLLFALAGMSGLYFLLHAEFLAAVQLVVYVGGTLILMIFGIMLTSKSPTTLYHAKRSEIIWAGILCSAIAVPLIFLLTTIPWPGRSTQTPTGPTIENLGTALLNSNGYLVPFELISVLLLAVMIGAAYLAKGRRNVDSANGGKSA